MAFSPRRGLVVSVHFLGLFAVAFACTTPAQGPIVSPVAYEKQTTSSSQPSNSSLADAAVAPATSATSSATAPLREQPKPPEEEIVVARAWTDPIAIEKLAQDCAFAYPKEDAKNDYRPLGCRLSPGFAYQTCTMGHFPCDAVVNKCEDRCGSTCDACDQQCTTACETCKSPCTDDACKRACAKSCGECKQGCLRGFDKCNSATCRGKVVDGCLKDEKRKWKANNCRCELFDSCINSPESCQKLAPKCDIQYCLRGGPFR